MAKSNSHWNILRLFTFTIAAILIAAASLTAAQLQKDTLEAWDEYVRVTEERINQELGSSQAFFIQDRQGPRKAAADRKAVLTGEIVVAKMKKASPGGSKISVPGGTIQHWRGSVFIPNVTLEHLLAELRNPAAKTHRQEDVLESRLLERGDDFVRVYLKLRRSNIVTVTYNTEHLVHYRHHSDRQALSRSIATKIAELEHANTPAEREKPEGVDRGFLWRLNSYWRYQQVESGVLVECESLSLSRGIPVVLGLFVRPVVNKVARQSMVRTLASMRERFADQVG